MVTGNPVRPAIAALAAVPYVPPTDTMRLLVLGGSLGARVFSDVVPTALASLPDALRSRARGRAAMPAPRTWGGFARPTTWPASMPNCRRSFPMWPRSLPSAHLVIARAGASTVAELAIAGRPAILVPLPGAIDDHQSANARALAEARGASVIAQRDFSPDALRDRLAALLAAPDMLAHAAVRTQHCAPMRGAAGRSRRGLMRQEART